MDRNLLMRFNLNLTVVALRKESVDRNNPPIKPTKIGPKSLSARRAWIEIPALLSNDQNAGSLSARRAWIEIVLPGFENKLKTPSLSARRAWIEIRLLLSLGLGLNVALRKESVDRNIV